jgi:putative ABC transport system permease protein
MAFIISLPLGFFVMRKWLENFAYKIDLNWWIFAVAGLAALFIALMTVSFQSVKAALKNPVDALRYE